MKKSIFSLLFTLVGVGTLTTSCEDMLTPDLDRYTTNFSGKDTVNFYLGIMSNLQDMVEQNVLLGELRGDLVRPTEYASDSINDIINFRNLADGENLLLNRAAYYKVINQCNFYLSKADSMAAKNNNYYMRRELAQVQLVRAWTYMQLVQNYGKVPFILLPVDNSNTGWETNPEDWATPDNLLNLLESKGGLKQAYQYSEQLGYPDYGKFNNGSGEFHHKFMIFNANLIYGDLYLLRGANPDDYAQAATYYHKYLDEDCDSYVKEMEVIVSNTKRNGVDNYSAIANAWKFTLMSTDFVRPGENRMALPSASNTFFGKMLTRVPQVYGFDATSTNSTTSSTSKGSDGKEKEDVKTAGSVSLEGNYRNRQVEPSEAIERLSKAQVFVYNEVENGKQTDVKYLPLGDQRIYSAAPYVATDKGRLRFIQKFSPSAKTSFSALSPRDFSFRYGIPLYRTRQIYLRYAEAINRAGFPRYAFSVLRDGLSPETLPKATTRLVGDTTYTDATKTHIAKIEVDVYGAVDSIANGANSIDLNEIVRAKAYKWLDFSKFANKHNEGTRLAGAASTLGFGGGIIGFTDADTIWTYEKVVAQRIAAEDARRGGKLSHAAARGLLKAPAADDVVTTEKEVTDPNTGDTYKVITRTHKFKPTDPSREEVAAVETLIADELALETAFEGNRYYDLMRLARHRNAAGEDGSAWMAWLISRRDEPLAPYEQPTKTGSLYNFLLQPENWYLPAPKNK